MKKNNDNEKIDQILRHALSPTEEPNYMLNKQILNTIKEKKDMKKFNRKKAPVMAFTIISVVALGAVSAFGAIKYLSPANVATEIGDTKLADAFSSKNAISINKSQVVGNTKYSLLGMISGKSLSKYVEKDNRGKVKNDKTYIVTSIENTDGSKRPAISDKDYYGNDVIVTPLVKGINPIELNIYTMGGGYSEIVENGVQYRILECDTMEMFADKGVYLAICDNNSFNTIYNYNKTTGAIAPNKEYEGLNLLFDLPMDKSKANPSKAKKYLEELAANNESDKSDNTNEDDTEFDKLITEISSWSAEKIIKNCTKLDKLTQTLTPDKDGYIEYSYTFGKDGQNSEARILASEVLKDNKVGEQVLHNISGSDEDSLYVEMLCKNGDGNVELRVYKFGK